MKPLGFGLAFLGVTLQSLGLVLQKKAQNKTNATSPAPVRNVEEDGEEDDELELPDLPKDLTYLKSKTWRLGFFLFVCGSVFCFVALGWIGPSLLVIISSFALVMNLVMSPWLLEEARRTQDMVAVVLIIAGISLAITATELSEDEPELSPEELAKQISSPQAAIVWGVECGLFIALFYVCRLRQYQDEPSNNLTRFAFVARAATSATIGVLLATPTSVLIMNIKESPAVLWATAAAMPIQVVLDVHIQNRSLKFNDIMFHTPVSFCIWQIGTLVCAAIMYEQTKGFGTLQWALGGSGVGLTLIGVAISATRPFPGSYNYQIIQFL